MSHLEINIGFYILLGIVLFFHIVMMIVAAVKKDSSFKTGVEKRFLLYSYLAVCLLCYQIFSEDVIYRMYHWTFTNEMEMIICNISFVLILLHPFYLSPILWKSDKEQNESMIGEKSLSFYYMQYDIFQKKHMFMQIPVRMMFIAIGNIVRVAASSIYPVYLIVQNAFIFFYNVLIKPYNQRDVLVLDSIQSFTAMISTIILFLISNQDTLQTEDKRADTSSAIVYIPLAQIACFLTFYALKLAQLFKEYLAERKLRKKILPIDVFIGQTNSYQINQKFQAQLAQSQTEENTQGLGNKQDKSQRKSKVSNFFDLNSVEETKQQEQKRISYLLNRKYVQTQQFIQPQRDSQQGGSTNIINLGRKSTQHRKSFSPGVQYNNAEKKSQKSDFFLQESSQQIGRLSQVLPSQTRLKKRPSINLRSTLHQIASESSSIKDNTNAQLPQFLLTNNTENNDNNDQFLL